jgi:predicted nucleic-acid-binding protein
MIALDTNILARYLLKDDARQFAIAEGILIGQEKCTVPPTVMLELVWVLESTDISRDDITHGLRALLGLPNFAPHDLAALYRAIGWYEEGMDFGDAIHLAISAAEEKLATFDERFAKRAAKSDAFPEVFVPARG